MRLREVSALACGAALALGATFAVADQVYKWTDSEGHVHFSQTPPPSTTAGVQQVNVNPAAPDPQSLQNQQDLIQAQQDQQKKAKEAADKAGKPDPQAEKLKQIECDDLRTKLASLQQQGRAATVDAQGNVTYLDDDARAKQVQTIQDQLAKNCSGH